MRLIREIIEILSSDRGKLSDALMKTKVLLHRIGQKELVEWVNNELNGYPDMDSVPPYRILSAQVLVNAENMAYQVSSHPIPLGHLDKDFRNRLETGKIQQSLAVLEMWVEKDKGPLRSPIPMEANGLLEEGMDNSFRIQTAWSEVQVADITQILTQVRSRLMDFVLELDEQLAGDLSEEEVKARTGKFDAENLFNNAIFGNNTTILMGSSNTQSVNNTNVKGDFEALSKTLQHHGVSVSDISSLRKAIQEDQSDTNPAVKEFGPSVKGWLQTMLSKAVDMSWKIELGVAGSLLATALNNYYGWF